jgi:hypothetical protein
VIEFETDLVRFPEVRHRRRSDLPLAGTMRKTVPILSLLTAVASWAAYPGDDLLPTYSVSDSVSVREWGFGEVGTVSRQDVFFRARDVAGRIVRLDQVAPSGSGTDSTVLTFDWNVSIPSIYTGSPDFFSGTPSQIVSRSFHDGAQTGNDTTLSSWDSTRDVLVRTSSNQYGGCRWTDSSSFDAGHRMVFQEECSEDSGDFSTPVPLYYIYRAWYANPSDSMPVRESARDSCNGQFTLEDSLTVSGNPNRPDSLIWGNGGTFETLSRDSMGRVVETTDFDHGVAQATGTATYRYDPQGRLIWYIQSGNIGDTTQYLYTWSDATGIRPRAPQLRGFRLVGSDIEVNLPTSDRVRIDLLDPEGRVLANLADRTLPAGTSVIPLTSQALGFVRLHSSQGESVLLVPPR